MKILVLFAHPKLSGSVVRRTMLQAIRGLEHVTIRDLYAAYPGFTIDVAAEQAALLAHVDDATALVDIARKGRAEIGNVLSGDRQTGGTSGDHAWEAPDRTRE